MNNPDFNREKRSVRRAKEKAKRKTIIRLLDKEKKDRRTYKNLKDFFSFASVRKKFTGPEIVKNKRMATSIVYDLLNILKNKHIVEKIDQKTSPGRGKTDIYTFTTAGKIVAAYITENISLLEEAFKEIIEEEINPLKRFCLRAFLENYSTKIVKDTLEAAVRRAERIDNRGLDIDELVFELIQNAFILTPFVKDKEMKQIFRRNAELIEKSEYRDFIFQYFKMQMESHFLYTLEGEKLTKYAGSLRENPQVFHIPCEKLDCTNVLLKKSFLDVNIPQYCEECQKKLEQKALGKVQK